MAGLIARRAAPASTLTVTAAFCACRTVTAVTKAAAETRRRRRGEIMASRTSQSSFHLFDPRRAGEFRLSPAVTSAQVGKSYLQEYELHTRRFGVVRRPSEREDAGSAENQLFTAQHQRRLVADADPGAVRAVIDDDELVEAQLDHGVRSRRSLVLDHEIAGGVATERGLRRPAGAEDLLVLALPPQKMRT